jgi:hypothetical protein
MENDGIKDQLSRRGFLGFGVIVHASRRHLEREATAAAI